MMLNLSGRSTKSAKRLDLARVFRTTDQLTNRPTEITQPDSTEPSTKGARAKVMWGTTRRGRTILETGQEGESEAERERERERERASYCWEQDPLFLDLFEVALSFGLAFLQS